MVDTAASILDFLAPVAQQTGSMTPVPGSISASTGGVWDELFDSFINAGNLRRGHRKGSAGACSNKWTHTTLSLRQLGPAAEKPEPSLRPKGYADQL